MREHCTVRVRIPFKPNIFPRLPFHNFRAQLRCYSDIFCGKDNGKKTHQPFSYETCFNGDQYFVIVACQQSGCSVRFPI